VKTDSLAFAGIINEQYRLVVTCGTAVDWLFTLYSSSVRLATDSTVYLHTQPRVRPLPPPGGSSSGRASLSSASRTDEVDDDDDEVRIINGRRQFVEADSGLVPDLLAAADTGSTAPPARSLSPYLLCVLLLLLHVGCIASVA